MGLLVSDRPIDALRVLRDCSESSSFDDARESVTLPPAASDALPGPAAGGRTALTVWLQAHYETMRQRRGQRASVLQFMQDADMVRRGGGFGRPWKTVWGAVRAYVSAGRRG